MILWVSQEKHINLAHIESRKSKRVKTEVEIYAECSCTKKEFNELVQHLKDHVNIISYNTPQNVWSVETGESVTCNKYLSKVTIQDCIIHSLITGEKLTWLQYISIVIVLLLLLVLYSRLFGLCVCFGWLARCRRSPLVSPEDL